MLPVELIDHILSFLRGDRLALKACLKSHPFLSQLAEQYFYADVVITVTQDNSEVFSFLENISQNPHILNYLCTLGICPSPDSFSPPLLTPESKLVLIISMIPRMTNLTLLKISDTRIGTSLYNGNDFFAALRSCLQHSSVEDLHLFHFHYLPLSILDNAKNVKKLILHYCLAILEPMPESSYQFLETLVIGGFPDIAMIVGMTGRVANLKSLRLEGVLRMGYDWSGLPELLGACSNSLTELGIEVGDRDCRSAYTSDFMNGQGWIADNLQFPFTLGRHKRLEHLSISTRVFSSTEGRTYCAIPAILRLIRTAPLPIRNVLLRLHWMDGDISSFGRFDWSPLVHLLSDFPGFCPRIHLCISVTSRGPDIILDTLSGNSALMSLVERELVTLEPSMEGLDATFLIQYPEFHIDTATSW